MKKSGIILLILALGFIYHSKYINEFPSHIHAWAQSDRYALSFGFLDNGLNFFKPQTFVYNHQFPDKWTVPSENTISAVNFPIHDYIPALLMKISGNTSPWIFRMYILLYSFLGLFFLFKLSYAITKDYIKSAFVVIFAATSPVFVYYQAGFLPTIPSLSNTIIGMYFYDQYLKGNKNKDFWLSLLFLTLAALSRTTFVIPIVAVLAVEFIRFVKKEIDLIPKIIPICISVFSILFYLFYNGYLTKKYGSIFLNHLFPPENLEHARGMIKEVYYNWFFQYFTRLHYLIYIAIIVLSASFILIRKPKIKNRYIYIGLLSIIYLFGCGVFAFLMLGQFPSHDYYFLDTFFLPSIMFLIFILSFIPIAEKRVLKIITMATLVLISSLLILQPVNSQEERRETGFWDKTEITINNYKNSSAFLDSLGIPSSSKILVIDAVAPNIPFILMQRKGFAVMTTSRENIENALKWDYDYIVVQNEYFISDIYTPYPDVISKLNKIADNGKISVYTYTDNNEQSFLEFLGLNDKIPVLEKFVNFENTPDGLWENYNPTDSYAYSGNSSGHLTPEIGYGLTYKTQDLPALKENSCTLFFSSYFLTDTTLDCEIIVSISSHDQSLYYKSNNLKDIIQNSGEWEKVSLLFQLPKIQNDDYEFAIFIWNTGNCELYYDDFKITIY